MSPPWSRSRRRVQILAAILLTCNLTVFTSAAVFFGGVCLPIIHCNACPLTWFSCPIYTISEYVQFHSVPWLALGMLAAIGALAGRFFCGWICPMGLLQDLLQRVPAPRLRLPFAMRWLKYGILLGTVGAAAYWVGKEAFFFFCNTCPVATLEVTLPGMVLARGGPVDAGRLLRLVVLAGVLALVLLNARAFCKAFCPVGALVAWANKVALVPLRLDPAACIHCGRCDRACPMRIPVEDCSRTGRAVNRHSECIVCLECARTCPTRAIAWRRPSAAPGPDQTDGNC